MGQIDSLARYALLGRSGLRVSPLCLGTMTFGTEWGWGIPRERAFELMDVYAEAGGNFLDTADIYTGGTSEEIVGAWLRERGARDRTVLATKFSLSTTDGDPNGGGNGRKHMMRALEASLARLGTDCVDLYWVHAWDGVTPVDEIMRALDDAVRAGKVRYVGLSNVPGWIAARAQTLAELRGSSPLCALQLEYSLVERNIEREHVPLALALGMGIVPWSPLASGLLTGKFRRGEGGALEGEGRFKRFENSTHPGFKKLYTERNWRILDALREVAGALGRSPAQVAVAWATRRPGVTSTLLGATTRGQLEDTLRALDVDIPADAQRALDDAGAPDLHYPYMHAQPGMRGAFSGKTSLVAEPPWFRPRG